MRVVNKLLFTGCRSQKAPPSHVSRRRDAGCNDEPLGVRDAAFDVECRQLEHGNRRLGLGVNVRRRHLSIGGLRHVESRLRA